MEQEYSKIKRITLNNFMSHKDATFEFDDTNILNLCGYNDSGKSAVRRALDVLFYDGMSTVQNSCIKEGEDYFKVSVDFDDGVTISKTKSSDGKSIWLMSKNGITLYTNKKDTNIIAVDGVPQEISKYLGVVYDETTEQKLNLRVKEDRALLTDTTGGDNYKILSTVCHSETLSGASKLLTERRNKLQQDLQSKTTTLQAYNAQYSQIDVPSLAVLDKLGKQREICQKADEQRRAIEAVYNINKAISETIIEDEIKVETLSEKVNQLSLLDTLQRLKNELESPVMPELKPCDMTQLGVLENGMRLFRTLSEECVGIADELRGININRYTDLVELIKAYNDYSDKYRDYLTTENDLMTNTAELKALCDSNNIRVCKNCGSAVV